MEARLRRLGPNSKIINLKTPKECRTKIWLAGRGTSCEIFTKSKYASRQHFSITYREQKFFISDLQSANGTFLNDEKLMCEKVLSLGSIISVGVPSEMQNSPDGVVYVFESNSGALPREEQPSVAKNDTEPALNKKNSPEVPDLELENVNADADPRPKPKNIRLDEPKVDDAEKTVLNDSSSSDVVFIEPSGEPEKRFAKPTTEPKPAKRRKLEESAIDVEMKQEGQREQKGKKTETSRVPKEEEAKDKEEKNEAKPTEMDEEDVSAYEALTQVDAPEVKSEPDFLNYSLTEELIELSDSEEDWVSGLKQEGSKSPEGGDEDDVVVILETIIRNPCKVDVPPVCCKVEDDLTETDKKWMGRLLKIEKESDSLLGNHDSTEGDDRPGGAEVVAGEETEKVETAAKGNESSVASCATELNRLTMQEHVTEPEASSREEAPAKRVGPKKSVTFDMVPQVKYFEVPHRTRRTASEVGRSRFKRLIFNICNWNTHWLEECKRVAPDKDPPDICEERLRKIPKKFPSHSDYMTALVPAMLLHLWYKIRDKWVASGDSGFRQTVSFDSCEDHHADNLSVYKCTGLVQSVDAHRQLIREGHLVLLRLHQVQLPQFATPASEKYSRKLGYLVFGFVESKSYERFQDQRLHQSLAERCASIVGDLHVVRLKILVKKRPNFQVDKQKLIQLTVVRQISQEIGLFRGICFLPDSPLCSAVLKPSKIESPSDEPPECDLVFKGPLDDVQSDIVRKLSRACSSTDSLLRGVMGAAGTGKGQVIVALVLQLLYGGEWRRRRPKIIYCTQWSIPLDEMVLRLKTCRRAAGEPFSLVRVGPVREAKPEVRDLCVSNLANNRRNSSKRASDGRKIESEVEVIKEADVICTTCVSAAISNMCSAFEKLSIRDRGRKIICIIDEAMSCREAESVLPLLLGVTHLLLVGDVYQLEPPFSGEKTYSLGLDSSLFWRIYKNFKNVPEKEAWPIFVLRTQYRMCSSLSRFAGPLLYNTRLQKPTTRVADRVPNIKSHLLFVDQTPEDVVKGERENREARIVCRIAKAVARTARTTRTTKTAKTAKTEAENVRIAVITCESRQTESLQQLLPKTEFPEVEIDKIQASQGREFDVVVFAYDGRKIATSWLVTALTRARSSLFVFASEQSIDGNALLKKMAENAEKCGFLKYVNPEMSVKNFEDIVRAG